MKTTVCNLIMENTELNKTASDLENLYICDTFNPDIKDRKLTLCISIQIDGDIYIGVYFLIFTMQTVLMSLSRMKQRKMLCNAIKLVSIMQIWKL